MPIPILKTLSLGVFEDFIFAYISHKKINMWLNIFEYTIRESYG